ncbi:MAG TPA: medium chain dehydrogenase/reductase family protein [Gammaproteobacteria bacterium]|nr:medium chain dehydrogenase/reductase family protein [Gammaproteobacteria bacterium]
MRRIVIHRPGGYDVLAVEEHPDPHPAPGEVAIAVRAAGVNFADCITRMGLYAAAKRLAGYPITPGFEVAGTVTEAGAGSNRRPGEPVVALTFFGGYATRVVVPAANVFPIPAGWTFEQAAAFPTVFLTAWYGLHELAHPRPGARVLVHSAAGGVGQALVQLARRADCTVDGVVGAPHKVEAVRALGADTVIDKSATDLWKAAAGCAPHGYDVIFDANGAQTLRGSYEHLAPGGKLVVYGFHTMFRRGRGTPDWFKLGYDWLRTPRFDPLDMTQKNRSVLAFNLSFLAHRRELLREGMRQLLAWAEQGSVRPLPVTTFPFEAVAEAHRALESGQTVGKLVLVT